MFREILVNSKYQFQVQNTKQFLESHKNSRIKLIVFSFCRTTIRLGSYNNEVVWKNSKKILIIGVYFFEKSLSFLGPVLNVVFEIVKLPQNFSPKLGYFKKN